MICVNDALAEWLVQILDERKLSFRDLARMAGISHTTVSQVISGQRPATADFCISIAKPLGARPEDVLRLAGHLPPKPSTLDPEAEAIIQQIRALWAEIKELDPSGESLNRLTGVVINQAEAFRTAMKAMQRAEQESDKEVSKRD